MPVRMRDVAEAANVSVKTVSNVLRNKPNVGPDTRRRVLEIVAELDYRQNAFAQSLRSGNAGLVTLAVPTLRESYFAELAADIIDAAGARDLRVVIEATEGSAERELSLLNNPRRFTDGMIFSPAGLLAAGHTRLDTPFPLVVLGETIVEGDVDHVRIQGGPAAAAATRLLAQRGCRRIAAIGITAEGAQAVEGRMTGYIDALREAELPIDPRLFVTVESWRPSAGALAIRQLLSSGVEFDGVFAFNDALALGAMRELRAHGVAIPDDVAVMGFDDTDEAQFSAPALSTVDTGHRAMAELAVDMLSARIDGERVTGEVREVPYTVIERESTARLS